jgi:AcrR family transcriptional regulator
MTPADRRARERAETQRKILDAARRLFVVEGYESVTMRRIADACEYTPAALYNHFPDKAALLRTLCRLDFLALAERVSRVAAITDPLARLAATGMEYVRFGLEHPNHYRMMFLAPPPLPSAATDCEDQGDPYRDGYAFLRQVCTDAIAAGALRHELDDAELVAQTMWAGVHGVVALTLTMADDAWVPWRPVQQRAEALIATLLRGIAAPSRQQ